ncbi:hypothetical protein ACQ7HM_10940 [Williamsia sp. MIQD14]|uniref:hypothetical protein n=1 Tax=Williamsia sp. MIQD14 TaxID=3425703 RepID=UPI003DA0EC5D
MSTTPNPSDTPDPSVPSVPAASGPTPPLPMTAAVAAGAASQAAPVGPRVLGAITAAYSAALLVRPSLLARPCGFAPGTAVPRSVATLIRGIAVRDLAGGVAMVAAPPGAPLTAAIGVRVASDLGDAVVFGAGLTGTRAPKIAGFAAMWGALCAASTLVGRR